MRASGRPDKDLRSYTAWSPDLIVALWAHPDQVAKLDEAMQGIVGRCSWEPSIPRCAADSEGQGRVSVELLPGVPQEQKGGPFQPIDRRSEQISIFAVEILPAPDIRFELGQMVPDPTDWALERRNRSLSGGPYGQLLQVGELVPKGPEDILPTG